MKNIFKFFFMTLIVSFYLIPKDALAVDSSCEVFKMLYDTGRREHAIGSSPPIIRNELLKQCMYMPNPDLGNECQGIVTDYFDIMLQLITEEKPAEQAALMLGFCGPVTPTCNAGQTLQGNSCISCATGYYKEGSGNGLCALCPGGGTTSGTAASNHDSITDCFITSGSDSSGLYTFNNGQCNYTK